MIHPLESDFSRLRVGMLISTSYGTGPYRIEQIGAPTYIDRYVGELLVRTWPVVGFVLSRPGEHGPSYISGVRPLGDRWFTDQNDEVIVHGMDPAAPPFQPSLFETAPALPAPYVFDPDVIYPGYTEGVDYSTSIWTWHCEKCGRDWNGKEKHYAPPCPHCYRCYGALRVLVMEPRPEPPARAPSSYAQSLGYSLASVTKGTP